MATKIQHLIKVIIETFTQGWYFVIFKLRWKITKMKHLFDSGHCCRPDVGFWHQPDFHFLTKCNLPRRWGTMPIWCHVDVLCLLGRFVNASFCSHSPPALNTTNIGGCEKTVSSTSGKLSMPHLYIVSDLLHTQQMWCTHTHRKQCLEL